MTAFHDTTVTILKHVLDEQSRDLLRFGHRLDRAEAGASPAAVQSFRDQVAELTAVASDFRRLVTLVQAANAADAAGLPAVLTIDTRAKTPDQVTEAFVDVADAERYALRDEFVNADRTTLAEQLRARGAEQSAQDAEADVFHAQRRADEADANGEYVDYDEAAAVREIEREMAIEAGDDSELERQVAEDDARFERAVWLAQQEAQDFERHQANIARDTEDGPHRGRPNCEGCPDCIGYADPCEADALDGVL